MKTTHKVSVSLLDISRLSDAPHIIFSEVLTKACNESNRLGLDGQRLIGVSLARLEGPDGEITFEVTLETWGFDGIADMINENVEAE